MSTEQLLREACELLHNVNATLIPSKDGAHFMCVSLCQKIAAHLGQPKANEQQMALQTADTRPLVSDPHNLGYDLDGWKMVDRIARSSSQAGTDALAAMIDALLAHDPVGAYAALLDVRDAAVQS